MSSYDSTAQYYNAIYEAMKDYGQEAERLHKLIRAQDIPDDSSLLDVACGTGLHLAHLSRHYDCIGLDLSHAQLAIASTRVPNIPLIRGDMACFQLKRQFRVITNLFSAIGHLLSLEELQACISCMASHLETGGLLIIEPWLSPEMWQPGRISVEQGAGSDFTVIRVTTSRREGHITELEMHHFVARPPHNGQHLVATHHTALYTDDEYLTAMQNAGLKAWRDHDGLSTNGRGLFLGIKDNS